MKNYTDEQLISRVQSLESFVGWPQDGVLDIWVRSKMDEPDKFNDKVYTFDCTTGAPVFKKVCTGTSNAGSFGLLHFKTYNPYGCAVSVPDVITYESHSLGLHHGKPAYRQRKGIPYTRDNDSDLKAENYGKVYTDIIGLNCHRAGVMSSVIYNWSTACYVRNNLKEFLEWLRLMNGRLLSTVVLSEF